MMFDRFRIALRESVWLMAAVVVAGSLPVQLACWWMAGR
jgi:hypothetical protein